MTKGRALLVVIVALWIGVALFVLRRGQVPAGPTEAEIRETIATYLRDQRQSIVAATRGWDSVPGPGFTLYMPRDSYAAKHSARYSAEVADAIQHALEILGESRYPAHLRVYYAGSREEMKTLIGETFGGAADAEDHTVAFVASDTSRPVHRHEIMHAVSLLVWGHPGGRDGDAAYPTTPGLFARGGWLREGIAAAAENRCGEYSYEAIAAQMHVQGERIALDSLVTTFYEIEDLASYLQAGSLVNYLLATYGRDSFRKLWRSAGTDFQSAYGKKASVIEAEWQAWLGAVPDSARPPSIKAFREKGCT